MAVCRSFCRMFYGACFALVVSFSCFKATFADDPLILLPNTVIPNGCVFQNMGVYDNEITMTPIYEDISSSCEPGYYLPENSTECVLCEANHFCVGGENAIMQDCDTGLVSPTGTVAAGDCGKIMHVGVDSVYLTQTQHTTPAFAAQIDGNTYYANAKPVATNEIVPVTNGSSRSLKMWYDNKEYVIYDITVK